jgi:predicted TIM-barrel fold metal-dependent hydrolase
MQNVSTQIWDANLHIEPQVGKPAGSPYTRAGDTLVRFDEFNRVMAPFERVIVCGTKARQAGLWVTDEFVADFTATAPDQLIGFAGCDPTQPGYMAELMYAVETLHLRGVRLEPAQSHFDPHDPACGPVFAYCQKYGLPILVQTGSTFDRTAPLAYSRPALYDEIAISFPDLRIVLTQAGSPFFDECLAVMGKHPNLYAEISSLHRRPWQFYNLLVSAQENQVVHKLLFGTGYPFNTTTDAIAGLRGANQVAGKSGLPRITDETVQSILEQDACRLLGLA